MLSQEEARAASLAPGAEAAPQEDEQEAQETEGTEDNEGTLHATTSGLLDITHNLSEARGALDEINYRRPRRRVGIYPVNL